MLSPYHHTLCVGVGGGGGGIAAEFRFSLLRLFSRVCPSSHVTF
jgi:hypothetical protein